MSDTGNLKAWEGFWEEVPGTPGAAFWDAPAELTAERHLPLFSDHFDIGLPLVDLGCGNGTQTRFLASRYGEVHALDLSAAALGHARRADPAGAASYEQVDGTDLEALWQLHERLGDVNVYLRGVLHQLGPAARPTMVQGIALLTGRRGRVFAVELAEAARDVLLSLAQRPEGPPAKLLPVFGHGIAPGEVQDAEVPVMFQAAGLKVLAQGSMPLATTEWQADGSRLELPSKWLVAGHMVEV